LSAAKASAVPTGSAPGGTGTLTSQFACSHIYSPHHCQPFAPTQPRHEAKAREEGHWHVHRGGC
jgi:hypothetical protein